jgi:hypothetical protein
MMIEDKILLTARYVEGDLNEAEKVDFENRLLSDDELQQHLINYNDIHQSLKIQFANNPEDLQFKATLKELNKKYFEAETKVVSFRPFLKWASGIAAILVIGLFIWAPWNANPYHDFMDESVMLVTERGADQLTDLDKAANYFNNKDYNAAQTLLQKLNTQEPNNAMVAYYYGLTLGITKDTEKGKAVLSNVYKGESAFKYDAAYAIALIYLNENQEADGKIWLQKIPKGTRLYQNAITLLENFE